MWPKNVFPLKCCHSLTCMTFDTHQNFWPTVMDFVKITAAARVPIVFPMEHHGETRNASLEIRLYLSPIDDGIGTHST